MILLAAPSQAQRSLPREREVSGQTWGRRNEFGEADVKTGRTRLPTWGIFCAVTSAVGRRRRESRAAGARMTASSFRGFLLWYQRPAQEIRP